jgi:hypothetical protein
MLFGQEEIFTEKAYLFHIIILQVLNSELTAVRRACSSVQQGYKPMVTFLVVQKRHHTRFFSHTYGG